jgi:pyruvate/2-oxoglutarate/acetoin dehydrogenase E1 component
MKQFSTTMPKNVLESLNLGLYKAMQDSNEVYLLGEDLLDPYGGAFKVTKGLSTAFPDRVFTTPISEAAITGIAGGMALRNLRPVVEIMFGDFITLASDQIINHLSKFSYMYGDSVNCPVVIRTPMGGRRGYGPTHSQTLEKHFLGVPGIKVVAPFNAPGSTDIGEPGTLLYNQILTTQQPVLFIENKLQYLLALPNETNQLDYDYKNLQSDYDLDCPYYKVQLRGAPHASATITAYGYMAHLAMVAQKELAYKDEIFVELLIPTHINTNLVEPLFDSLRMTNRLLVIEEGGVDFGWGAEVLALIAIELGSIIKKSARLGAKMYPIPAARHLEELALPGVNDIIACVRKLVC